MSGTELSKVLPKGVHPFRTLNLMSGILKRMPLDAGSAEGDDDG